MELHFTCYPKGTGRREKQRQREVFKSLDLMLDFLQNSYGLSHFVGILLDFRMANHLFQMKGLHSNNSYRFITLQNCFMNTTLNGGISQESLFSQEKCRKQKKNSSIPKENTVLSTQCSLLSFREEGIQHFHGNKLVSVGR